MKPVEHSQTRNTQYSEATAVNASPIQPLETTDQHTTLRIDFKWGKFKSLVSDVNKPDKPLYIIKYKLFSPKQIIYKSASTNDVIGTSSIHVVSIDPDYECRGRRDTLVAQKRFKTLYTHRSGFLKNPQGQPAVMTWTGDVGASKWDFVCTDEQQMPVAKFTANLWGVKKIGKIELMGPSSHEEGVRDEMLITGMTLAYCMVLRTSNIFNLLGSVFADPAHDKKYKSEPLPPTARRKSSSDSFSLSQMSTAAPNTQTDVRHRQPHSGPSTEAQG
ncbi:uncharacterized protein N7484_003210 [Penicillium longicatenatum]|uniref:uncharacterized protein n=1 Tax=Penicillium longicatenatum TaxID=1561947 RepID=UPI0025482B80|nr:uncharacterized protein N7484_003210 [Penicillium longicatenatum]KAJ5649487.1 hypothetical protein N7484_003210 [Penicillium longicatenatum]